MTGTTSVVCVQNETSTCFKEMKIPTYACPGGTEAYRLKTDVVGSVFCFGDYVIVVQIFTFISNSIFYNPCDAINP